VTEPRTFDLRLWVTADEPWKALERFFTEVVELAEAHPGIEPRWTSERTRRGRPRIDNEAGARSESDGLGAGRRRTER
jgi:hypothetical protein